MSYKGLQLSPQASTHVVRTRVAIQDPWCASVTSSREIEFLPSWMEDEVDCESIDRNGVISGLAISVAFSASFWAGVAFFVMRVWR